MLINLMKDITSSRCCSYNLERENEKINGCWETKKIHNESLCNGKGI
jgi:hypothetical protein